MTKRKKLIEDYKERVKNIYAFLDGCAGQRQNRTIIRARERALIYNDVIKDLEDIDKD